MVSGHKLRLTNACVLDNKVRRFEEGEHWIGRRKTARRSGNEKT